MLMSKSRLEKFLYALYSLDSSDLPTPLSRIEELYKCWVTGEKVPSFKPLSRVEKYLMVILGLYDLETQVEQRVLCTENNDVIVDENENYICLDEVTSGGIPAPISRIEKLLYKLATGDDNLDDIKSFLSEHEELLAEIIRNGGVGGNIDIEYVLYTLSTEFNTLYNTTEKPIKSAILKGNTLVNISPLKGEITITPGSVQFVDSPFIKSNTTFTISFNCLSVPTTGFIEFRQVLDNTQLTSENINVVQGYNRFKVTTVNKELNRFRFKNDSASTTDFIFNNLMIIEGDYTNKDIPYFEGMKSVQMPVLKTVGKNIFDYSKHPLHNKIAYTNGVVQYWGGYRGTKSFIPIEENKTYTFSNNDNRKITYGMVFYDESKTVIGYFNDGRYTFTTPPNCRYINFAISHDKELEWIQIEEGSIATTYEPYKSNILTVNEEVELHGIGDVRDELNPFTGELTQRIGEFVFDGDERFKMSTSDNNAFFYHELGGDMLIPSFTKKMISNNLLDYANYATIKNTENSMYTNGKSIYIHLTNDINSVSLLQTYLANNPIKIITCLSNESVKTVDLSVVDQDGDNTKLSTFDDLTHVTLSSEGLIPEVKLEVATKNEEVLNTMSLEMDGISTTQNDLQETSNTQSENVDATMIATTEIYEELL